MSSDDKPQGGYPWWASITPDDSPKTPEDLQKDPKTKHLSSPDVEVGKRAFNFDLPLFEFADGIERATGQRFHLEEVARSRPVALIFGSYT